MEFNKNMDIWQYIDDKMEKDNKDGFLTRYMVRSATGESPFGNQEIVLVHCSIPSQAPTESKTIVYEVLDGTSVIDAYALKSHKTEMPMAAFSSVTPFSVKLPETVHTIGQDACRHTKLQSINLKNVINIADEAFYHSEIPEANLDNVHAIGENAFSDCKYLKTITIGSANNTPLTPVDIKNGAFTSCEELETVKLKTDVILGRKCFFECKSLKSIDWEYVCGLRDYSEDGPTEFTTIFTKCDMLEMVDLSCCKNINTLEQPSLDIVPTSLCFECKSLHTIKFPEGAVLLPWNISIATSASVNVYGVSSFIKRWNYMLAVEGYFLKYLPETTTFYGLDIEKVVEEAKELEEFAATSPTRSVTLTEKDDCYILTVSGKGQEELGTHKMIFMKNDGSESSKDTSISTDNVRAETNLFD